MGKEEKFEKITLLLKSRGVSEKSISPYLIDTIKREMIYG